MSTSILVAIWAFAYGATLLASLVGLLLSRKLLQRVGLALLVVGFIFNTWAIAGRWVDGGQPPFRTLYETMIFYPWCVAAVTLVLVSLYRLYLLIPFAVGVSIFGIACALFKPDIEIINLPPALQSGWFIPHVVTYFMAYAALFISFALAVLALAQPWWVKRGKVNSGLNYAGFGTIKFEQYAHQAAVFGICTLTLGLAMGAFWGKVAWGDYWSWDPKENWALVCWLAYMIYLHLRLIAGWQERRAMWVLVFAFGAVVFTYLGINILPAATGSLHAYQ
jgi:cytochrome c-type biogenesis protein CcsB